MGGTVSALYSADAVEWQCVGTVEFAGNRTVEAGLLAIGLVPRYAVPTGSAPGTALRFSSFRLACEAPCPGQVTRSQSRSPTRS